MITPEELDALRRIALDLHGAAQTLSLSQLKNLVRERAFSIQRLCDNAETCRQIAPKDA